MSSTKTQDVVYPLYEVLGGGGGGGTPVVCRHIRTRVISLCLNKVEGQTLQLLRGYREQSYPGKGVPRLFA